MNVSDLQPMPKGTQIIDCSDNDFEQLPVIPKGIKSLICSRNKLTSITNLPDTLQTLNCSNNELYELELPDSMQVVDCSNNNLRYLDLPKNLRILICQYNQLEYMTIPWGLTELRDGYSDDAEIAKLECYNMAAERIGLEQIESLDAITEDHYDAVVYANPNKQIARFTDLALIFPKLPPYVLAEIAYHESPTIPAFDVAQIGGFLGSLKSSILKRPHSYKPRKRSVK